MTGAPSIGTPTQKLNTIASYFFIKNNSWNTFQKQYCLNSSLKTISVKADNTAYMGLYESLDIGDLHQNTEFHSIFSVS